MEKSITTMKPLLLMLPLLIVIFSVQFARARARTWSRAREPTHATKPW